MSMHPLDTAGRPARRHWRDVMRPGQLAAVQPSRLSLQRSLMARMIREKWDIRRQSFDIGADGRGSMIYTIDAGGQQFSFIGLSFPPRSEGRTGRIIGRAWDMMGTLNEGPATEADIEAAAREIPLLYRGRATGNALIWARANRSNRLFDRTLEALAEGRQPDIGLLGSIGYLMRNTGLDGNGTFGTRSFPSLGSEHKLGGFLDAQFLAAYLMREFSCDLVEHLARLKSSRAVPLDPAIRSWLGVGNGSALGLMFYIQKHPRLVSSWIAAREDSIAAALALEATPERISRLRRLLQKATAFREQDRMVYETFTSSAQIASELKTLLPLLDKLQRAGTVNGIAMWPLRALAEYAAGNLAPETHETLLSLMIELVPELADRLAAGVAGADELHVQPRVTAGEMLALLEHDYDWALATDMGAPGALDYVWYKSETAEEPRRGLRHEIPEARDLGLDLPGDLQRMRDDLRRVPAETDMARFLLAHPGHRASVARAQSLRDLPYHTPLANIHSRDFVPIDMVRLMNAGLHGLDKTRDFLQRNLRGVLYHGAPTPDQLRAGADPDWFYPEEPRQ